MGITCCYQRLIQRRNRCRSIQDGQRCPLVILVMIFSASRCDSQGREFPCPGSPQTAVPSTSSLKAMRSQTHHTPHFELMISQCCGVLHTSCSGPAPCQHTQHLSCAIPNLLQCPLPSSQLPWFHLLPGGPGVALMPLALCLPSLGNPSPGEDSVMQSRGLEHRG